VPARPSEKPLRRSLRASIWEGVFAEAFNACAGPMILVGWAMHLGCSPLEIGVVGTLPQLAQALQVPAAWATALVGRRRLAIATIAVSRQSLLPLALLPLLGLSPSLAHGLLLATAAASAALATAGNVAWTAWMGELVPARIRGRFFGRRAALCVLGGVVAAVATARLLDAARAAAAIELGLSLLALAASAVGAITTILMRRQHEPPSLPAPPPRVASALEPLRDPQARSLLAYQAAWNASVGVGGGYFTYHLLGNLHASFLVVALHAAGGALAKTLSAPLLGRAIDRVGARPVLAACSFASAGLPLLWLCARPDVLWPLAIDALVGGAAWGGHGLASFAMPLAIAPRRGRAFYLAAFSTAGGVAYAAATAAGGAAAAALPPGATVLGHAWKGLELVFVVSAAGRLASAFLALRIAEPGARGLGDLHRFARASLAFGRSAGR
jgi:MFS family permease